MNIVKFLKKHATTLGIVFVGVIIVVYFANKKKQKLIQKCH